jgi:hypothetical protein
MNIIGSTISIGVETLSGTSNIQLAFGNFTSLAFAGVSSTQSIIDCAVNGPFFSLIASTSISINFTNIGFTRYLFYFLLFFIFYFF